jgi:hypothetical protein
MTLNTYFVLSLRCCRGDLRRHADTLFPPFRYFGGTLERRAAALRDISDHRGTVITDDKSHLCCPIASGVH